MPGCNVRQRACERGLFKSSPGMGKGYNPSEYAPITSRPRASLGLTAFNLFPARAAQGQLSPISLAGQRKPSGSRKDGDLPFSLAARKDGPGRKPRYGAQPARIGQDTGYGGNISRTVKAGQDSSAPPFHAYSQRSGDGATGKNVWKKLHGFDSLQGGQYTAHAWICWRNSIGESIGLISRKLLVQVQPPVYAGLAQWQSGRSVIVMLSVQVRYPAPTAGGSSPGNTAYAV